MSDDGERPDDRRPTDEGERPDPDGRGSFSERDDGDGVEYTPPEVSRRNAAKLLAAVGGAAAVGSVAVSAVAGLSGAGFEVLDQRIWVEGTYLVDQDGNRLSVADALPRGSGNKMVVLPEEEPGVPVTEKAATTLLLRYAEDAYEEPTVLDWTIEGYVAYSMVCTHAGCLVSSEAGDDLLCPCHVSRFDPTSGATVVSGPAGRPLPQLPLAVSEDGELLVATGPFEGPVGPASGEGEG